MTSKGILVTGGAGYIGSHMVYKLLEENYSPTVVDNLSTGNKSRLKSDTPLYIFDLNDQKKLADFFQSEKIDVVMHFAASVKVDESVQDPYLYYQNNFFSTLNLLKAMAQHNVKKIIFSSTAAIFGDPQYVPVDENHPKNPQSPYGASKLMCEQVLRDFDLAYGIKSVCLRYFNAAGADPLLRTGFSKEDAGHLIPIVLRSAMQSNKSVKIFGNDYDTSDGTCIRDYIHVMDLCQAHLLALNYLMENNQSAVFNLGNGQGYTVKEVVQAVEKVTGKAIEAIDSPRRQGDIAAIVADSRGIQEKLCWKPQYPNLEMIAEHAWNWIRKN